MSNITAKNILFIGAGSNDFGLESEHDAAIYQVMPELKGHGINVFLIDENPYALSLESLAAETIWKPLTVENVKQVIKHNHIDTVLPLFGGVRAVRLWADVVQS
jgi:carbamoyl-phosphate synthase large subunit